MDEEMECLYAQLQCLSLAKRAKLLQIQSIGPCDACALNVYDVTLATSAHRDSFAGHRTGNPSGFLWGNNRSEAAATNQREHCSLPIL
jgi:hypothetical protein